ADRPSDPLSGHPQAAGGESLGMRPASLVLKSAGGPASRSGLAGCARLTRHERALPRWRKMRPFRPLGRGIAAETECFRKETKQDIRPKQACVALRTLKIAAGH